MAELAAHISELDFAGEKLRGVGVPEILHGPVAQVATLADPPPLPSPEVVGIHARQDQLLRRVGAGVVLEPLEVEFSQSATQAAGEADLPGFSALRVLGLPGTAAGEILVDPEPPDPVVLILPPDDLPPAQRHGLTKAEARVQLEEHRHECDEPLSGGFPHEPGEFLWLLDGADMPVRPRLGTPPLRAGAPPELLTEGLDRALLHETQILGVGVDRGQGVDVVASGSSRAPFARDLLPPPLPEHLGGDLVETLRGEMGRQEPLLSEIAAAVADRRCGQALSVLAEVAVREDIEPRHVAAALLNSLEFLKAVAEYNGIIPVRCLEVTPVAPPTHDTVVVDPVAVGDEVAILRIGRLAFHPLLTTSSRVRDDRAARGTRELA